MKRASRSGRRWLALFIWLAGLLLFFGLAWWNLNAFRSDAENRLISEAGRTAAQIAALASLPGIKLNTQAAHAITAAVMEDERIYAVRIQIKDGVTEASRRNYLWEPIPWDDEIAENCVQGMNPIRVNGQVEGKVDVWLSPRLSGEEEGLLLRRERIRFAAAAFLWTLALLLLFWHWGEFRHLGNILAKGAKQPENAGEQSARAEKIVLGLGQDNAHAAAASAEKTADGANGDRGACPLVNAALARQFQRQNPGAWLVTAGMFRQTFARGPALISRLYAAGEFAGLCHLGRMLEQAAPCVGARPLAAAARAMQAALNDPDCGERALPVENCARVLEQTLAALGGKDTAQNSAAPREAPEEG